MKLKEFKAVLKRAVMVGIVTENREPILISKPMALKLVRSVHAESVALRSTNFSGRIFFSVLGFENEGGSAVLIGVSPEHPGAEEVTP